VIHYSFKTTQSKGEKDSVCCFRIYEDEDVTVSQIFERYSNGMSEPQSDLFIKHKGIDPDEDSENDIVKHYSGIERKFNNGRYKVPTKPMDKYLIDGLNTITDRFPKVVYRNDSDSIQRFSSKCFMGCVYNFNADINPGSSILYRDSGFSERYIVFKKNALLDTNQIDVIHSKKYPSMMSMYDHETSEITLFKIDNQDEADIVQGTLRIVDTEECFDIYPNYYRVESVGDFVVCYDKFGVSTTIKKHPSHKDGIKYYHNRTLANRAGDNIIIKINSICYHPAIATEHGILYRGEGKGFIETLEATVLNNRVVEADQIFEEIDEKEFLVELMKERTKE